MHLSNERALEAAVAARLRGVQLAIEAVVPHLMLDKSYAERPDFEGAKYVMSPPLREPSDSAALWNCLAQGIIDTVGTDTRRSTRGAEIDGQGRLHQDPQRHAGHRGR